MNVQSPEIMKKTLFLMAAAVCCAVAPAFAEGENLVADFTSAPFSTLGEQTNVNGKLGSTGWSTKHFNSGKYSVLAFSESGLTFTQEGDYRDWSQTVLYTDLEKAVVSTHNGPYTITFDLTGGNGQRGFVLASETYSLAFGINYDGNVAVASMEGDFFSAYKSLSTMTALTGEGSGSVDLSSCTLTLNGTDLTVTAGGFSGTYTVADNYNFTTAGFTIDGGKMNVTSKGVTIVPEPATATLSLLALAGLAARRRRH